jgi:cytoskeletal protein RodZ
VTVTPVTSGLGSELREARVQRGLTLEQVTYETRIRTRYLEALEDERFDDLPGEAYAKGFLRTYADFLELDGTQMLARYRARFPRRSEPPVAPRPQPPYEPKRLVTAALAAAALLLLAVGGLAAWQLDRGDGKRTAVPSTTPATTQTAAKPKPAPAAQPPRRGSLLALTAVSPCWLEVRLGGARGKLLWVGTLQPGRRLRLGLERRIWFRAGNAAALRAPIDDKPRRLSPDSVEVLVTSDGLRAV